MNHSSEIEFVGRFLSNNIHNKKHTENNTQIIADCGESTCILIECQTMSNLSLRPIPSNFNRDSYQTLAQLSTSFIFCILNINETKLYKFTHKKPKPKSVSMLQ